MTIIEYDHSQKQTLEDMLCAYFPEVDSDIPEDIIRGKLSDMIQDQHDRGILRISIGVSGDIPMGFSIFQIDTPESDWCKRPGWGFLREFYIAPAYRRNGCGRTLAAFTEAALAEMGAERLYLTSEGAVPFWTACGWQKTGARCSNGLHILVK